MTPINLAANKETFQFLARKYIKREGLEKVLAWLDSTDFYTAPASTKYHLSCEGGLCQHSLNVFYRMLNLSVTEFPSTIGEEGEVRPDAVFNGESIEHEGAYNMENVAIVALFHDICKANCYVRDYKNVKVNGKWEQQEYWKWDEQFVYGHGTKSVYMLQQFMRLYIDEAQAIRFHMGGREDPLTDMNERQYTQVFEKSKFAVMLHLADMMATWLDEYGTNE